MLGLERGLPSGLHDFINEIKQKFTIEIAQLKCRPFFPHEYALSRLKKNGYKIAVCSNSIANTINVMLKKAEIIQYFEIMLSNQDVSNAKPDPEIYLSAMKGLGISPEEALILEDNEHGLKAAYASGAHVMKIETIANVNYFDIMEKISTIEKGNAC